MSFRLDNSFDIDCILVSFQVGNEFANFIINLVKDLSNYSL